MKKNNIGFDLIIPIKNEVKNLIKLYPLLSKNIKTKFRILLCYDSDEDDVFQQIKFFNNFNFKTILIKNLQNGPCEAVKTGMLYESIAKCVIVYPADDFLNYKLLDKMYNIFTKGSHVVVASRFIPGGSMKGCPFIKSILVKLISNSLYILSSIPSRDASNGFRLFSRELLNRVEIESNLGFAYSLELLVKAHRLNLKISEVPAHWAERTVGKSKFKILKWSKEYLKWYFYGLSTTWLNKKIKL